MAAGLLVVAVALAICSVIVLAVLRADLKEQDNKSKKGKK